MRGLDAIVGVSWGDVGDAGKAAFPYIHAAGKGLATSFGAGQVADIADSVERGQGWLPPKSASSSSTSASSSSSTPPKKQPIATALGWIGQAAIVAALAGVVAGGIALAKHFAKGKRA